MSAKEQHLQNFCNASFKLGLLIKVIASRADIGQTGWHVRYVPIGDVEVGGLPEGAAFTPDGKYLYIGNYLDQDHSILKINGTKITPIKRFKLSGHPASIRMSTH